MSVEVQDLAQYVKTDAAEPTLPVLLLAATALVRDFLGETDLLVSRCPDEIRDLAVLIVGHQLWQRRNSPDGISSWDPVNGTPQRLANDPLAPAKALLNRYRLLGAVG